MAVFTCEDSAASVGKRLVALMHRVSLNNSVKESENDSNAVG